MIGGFKRAQHNGLLRIACQRNGITEEPETGQGVTGTWLFVQSDDMYINGRLEFLADR